MNSFRLKKGFILLESEGKQLCLRQFQQTLGVQVACSTGGENIKCCLTLLGSAVSSKHWTNTLT